MFVWGCSARRSLAHGAVLQVVALQLRSKGAAEDDLPDACDEMDYALLLNRLLPPRYQGPELV